MNKPFLKSIALSLFMALTSMTWAQDAGSMPSRADLEQRIEDTVEDLGLSEEQATEFRALENKFIDDRKSTIESATDHDRARKQVREMSNAKLDKMKALLTPEQFKIYRNLVPKRRPGGKHAKKPRRQPEDDSNNRK